MIEKPKPIQVGDEVLVKATVTEVLDDDPHDPTIVVWFNGMAHHTTVMNIQQKPGKVYRKAEPTSRSLRTVSPGERFVIDSRPMLPLEPPTEEELKRMMLSFDQPGDEDD